jgi:hypothetical protein
VLPPGRRPITVALSVIATVAALAGVAFGIFQLSRHGESLSSGAANRATTGKDVTTYAIPSLGVSIALPGIWSNGDSNLSQSAVSDAVSLSGGATGRADVVARKGNVYLTIVSVTVRDPASVLETVFTPQRVLLAQTDGTVVVRNASQRGRIAGKAAVISDEELHAQTGELIGRARDYYLDAGDHIVVVEAGAPADQADRDLPGVYQAVSALASPA